MVSKIEKRFLTGIVIGLVLDGALWVLLSTARIGDLETRNKELEAVGPDAYVVTL